ncbi:hypothetical protein AA313_de0206857 [Arthrobotrys entomopaga]|nr:hypothetical protein AA313_de0206857 [Arthrobotrys entomopaga]
MDVIQSGVYQLPPEIWHAIAEQLPTADLRTFSLCSKFLREIALPMLFTSIKLYKATVEAFEGGSLRGFEHRVRHVTLAELIRPVTFEHLVDYSWAGYQTDTWPPGNEFGQFDLMMETIELADILSAALSRFSALTSLYIPFNSSSDYEWVIPLAIFRRIARYPSHKDLKKLSVNCTILPYSSGIANEIAASLQASQKHVDFLGGFETEYPSKIIALPPEIPFPTTLEEVGSSWYDIWSVRYDTGPPCESPTNTPPKEQPLIFPHLFYKHSLSNFRKLKLKMNMYEVFGWKGANEMLPNVEDLWLHISSGGFIWLTEKDISLSLPNLRFLRVDAQYYTKPAIRDRVPYYYVMRMPHLKRLRLPIPKSRSKINVAYDCRNIMKTREEAGLQQIECLELFTNGHISGDEVYSPEGPKPRPERKRPICSIEGGEPQCEWYTEEDGIRSRYEIGILKGDVERWYQDMALE